MRFNDRFTFYRITHVSEILVNNHKVKKNPKIIHSWRFVGIWFWLQNSVARNYFNKYNFVPPTSPLYHDTRIEQRMGEQKKSVINESHFMNLLQVYEVQIYTHRDINYLPYLRELTSPRWLLLLFVQRFLWKQRLDRNEWNYKHFFFCRTVVSNAHFQLLSFSNVLKTFSENMRHHCDKIFQYGINERVKDPLTLFILHLAYSHLWVKWVVNE